MELKQLLHTCLGTFRNCGCRVSSTLSGSLQHHRGVMHYIPIQHSILGPLILIVHLPLVSHYYYQLIDAPSSISLIVPFSCPYLRTVVHMISNSSPKIVKTGVQMNIPYSGPAILCTRLHCTMPRRVLVSSQFRT